jgi:transcriptional regulator with XRE-family HTH domain
MDNSVSVGKQVATLRRLRGVTQRQLAQRAHVSLSLLTKVECGQVPASPAFIGAVARALRVDVPRITGQPYMERTSDGPLLLEALAPIRRAVAAFDLPPESVPPRPAADLAVDVAHVSDLGRNANYARIGELLPGLLEDLAVAVHSAAEADRPYLLGLLAEAYGGATAVSAILGYLDLRDRVLDRIEWASRESGDPLRVFRAQWQRGVTLLHQAAYPEGLRLMDRIRREMGDNPGQMDLPALSIYGSTHLRSGILAARAGARSRSNGNAVSRDAYEQRAWTHIEAAREIADLIGSDRDDYGVAFGPSNVAQHEVAVAVELEEGTEAVRRSRRARMAPTAPPVRRGHHYIDLARGYFMDGNHGGALRCLQRARRIAPQQTRYHPMVRETVLALANARRGTEDLARFASWLGID